MTITPVIQANSRVTHEQEQAGLQVIAELGRVGEDCIICMEKINRVTQSSEKYFDGRTIVCCKERHRNYHGICMDVWSRSGTRTCPECRGDLIFPEAGTLYCCLLGEMFPIGTGERSDEEVSDEEVMV